MNIEATPENVEALLDVFLDGYVSGCATALHSCGLTIELADLHAQTVASNALRDPAVAEVMRDHIRARLAGTTGDDEVIAINWEA